MAVPKYYEFFPSFMKCLADGGVHTIQEIRAYCADYFNLSEEDRTEMLNNGRSLKYVDRIGWCRTYLKKAGLVVSPARGQFVLSDLGKAAVAYGVENINLDYLMQFESFREFFGNSNMSKKEKKDEVTVEETSSMSPQELMDNAFSKINASLADDLLSEIMKMNCYDFEKLVVELLVKMGYGTTDYRKSTATKKSGDEGIDGIVTADRFGFNVIYTQAKLYDPSLTIGRPEIQKFLGALAGQGATKGIFITTAKYSSEARTYVEKQLLQKIVLVDGKDLTDLMIEFNLGVTTTSTYEIKRVDYDFFQEDI